MSTSLNGVDQVGSVTSKNELELTAMELMETKGAALVCVPGGINTLPKPPKCADQGQQPASVLVPTCRRSSGGVFVSAMGFSRWLGCEAVLAVEVAAAVAVDVTRWYPAASLIR
jgi:hypothetical protein